MRSLGLLDPRLLRSVNLEADWQSEDPCRNYVLGSTAVGVLKEVLQSAQAGPRHRAFTITGPYGTGKSALALFLTDLLAGPKHRRERAWSMVRLRLPAAEPPAPFLPVLATCWSHPLEGILTQAYKVAGERVGAPGVLSLEQLVEVAAREGYGGLLVVLDELGKALEHAGQEPDSADLFVLQQIAEFASRSELPVVVLGILHQSFAGYSGKLDPAGRNEWNKVQGRFRDLPFLPSEAALAHLIAHSICGEPDDPEAVDCVAREVWRLDGLWPSTLSEEAFLSLARKSWPLHPMTVTVLPTLMRRFGQNERSLFAFLCERGLLQDATEGSPWVLLSELFDHVSDWVGHGTRIGAAARKWRVALQLLQNRLGWDKQERDVLRTVALLTALGTVGPYRATTETIQLALPGFNVWPVLERLKSRSAIVHRRHLGSWVLWEGSDVDLDELLEQAMREVTGRVDPVKVLEEAGALRPLIARKHYEESGTLRWFRPIVLTDAEGVCLPQPSEDPTNCLLVLALGESVAAQDRFEHWARTVDRPDTVIAVPRRAPQLRAAAEELEALLLAERRSPELRGDRVARAEVAARKAALTSLLAEEADRLLEPTDPGGCRFFHRGERKEVKSRRDFSTLLSQVCDHLFAQAPTLRNELLNRRRLSSAAAAARNVLLARMLQDQNKPRLGLTDGYPPERAMYESVLLASGLHRKSPSGEWRFTEPDEGSDPLRLLPSWRRIEELVFDSAPNPIPVTELAKALARPPYGLLDGPFVVLLTAFLLAKENEVSVYREGAFLPELSAGHLEVLQRRPDLFALAGSRLEGARLQAAQLICQRLGVQPAALLPAVRHIVREVAALPDRARTTRQVSPYASGLRRVVLEAKSPETLFFRDLPASLGLDELGRTEDPDLAQQFFIRLRNALDELRTVVEATRRQAKAKLACAAGLPASDEGFEELRAIAPRLMDRLEDPKARELCRRLSEADAASAEAGALSLVVMRPLEAWTDDDLDRFDRGAHELLREVRQEVRLLGVTPDPELHEKVERIAEDLHGLLQSRYQGESEALVVALRRLVRRLESERKP